MDLGMKSEPGKPHLQLLKVLSVFVRSSSRQIEGKVVEISRLQEIFAEKVLQQVRRRLTFLLPPLV